MITISFEALDGKYLDKNAESFKKASTAYFRTIFPLFSNVTPEEYSDALIKEMPSCEFVYKKRKARRLIEENAIYVVTLSEEELTMFLLKYSK